MVEPLREPTFLNKVLWGGSRVLLNDRMCTRILSKNYSRIAELIPRGDVYDSRREYFFSMQLHTLLTQYTSTGDVMSKFIRGHP